MKYYQPSALANKLKLTSLTLLISSVLSPVYAQDSQSENLPETTEEKKSSADVLSENIIVTVRKRTETIHEAPVAVTAFGEDQLDALKIRDFNDLSDGMANVMLEDIGTSRGGANFSIRGLGINSSIPSIDPTVGVFVDGVFMGTTGGIIMDMFDIESIEVLRGPQGILFGRNVTGGAILINTQTPHDSFDFKGKVSLTGGGDGGNNKTGQASFNIPLTDNLFTKLALYYNNDDGYFKNSFDGSNHGAIQQTMIRSTTLWEASDDLSIIFKYEYVDADGDGPSGQNHTNGLGINPTLAWPSPHPLSAVAATFDRDSHDFSINDKGTQKVRVDLVSINADWEVAGGTATYIFGYRDFSTPTTADIDSQPFTLFHAAAWQETEQFSHELRFNKELENETNITFGVYQYTNDLAYHERRILPLVQVNLDITGDGIPELLANGIYQDGGGFHDTTNVSVFGAVDFQLTDQMAAVVGMRYTKEEKTARIASLSENVSSINPGFIIPQGPACNLVLRDDCTFDFEDKEDWTSLSPKVGVTYTLNNNDLSYAHWTKGFRSGGYNLRNTADISTPELEAANGPGPFDQESVASFEVGYKAARDWGHINAAVFYTTIDDMQREVNLAAPNGTTIQVIKNTAETTMMGLEIDALLKITDNLVATFNVGLIDTEYDKVIYDLNGDGVIDNDDLKLEIPRVPKMTYSFGLNHDTNLGTWGSLYSRISYSFRDKTYYTDNNLGFIDEQNILNVGFDIHTNDGNWVYSIFGKNLLNEVKHGNDTQLSFGTFAPLAKGRIIGVEATYRY